MEGVRTFLESSTIHGLTYISTTRKYARLFWILIILSGFIGASFLIKESFDSWSESPVKTTIETLPISDIKFPKVTVCPPKNTFTDLNYDLILTKNLTLTEEMKDEMFKYACEIFEEDILTVNNVTKLDEKDRFYNWYVGYTDIRVPHFSYKHMLAMREHLEYRIYTSAPTGVVTTQYYGDRFQPELVERDLTYFVWVYPPNSLLLNKNVTLHFKLEKLSMKGLARTNHDLVAIASQHIDAEITNVYKNFTPPKSFHRDLTLSRHVGVDELEEMKLELMPGFRLSWWYTSAGVEIKPEHKYADNERTELLVR